jgi:hypothetical protein
MAEREEARRRAAAQQAGGAPVAQGQTSTTPAPRPPALAPAR